MIRATLTYMPAIVAVMVSLLGALLSRTFRAA